MRSADKACDAVQDWPQTGLHDQLHTIRKPEIMALLLKFEPVLE